jgi:hypothetical protein
MAGYNTVTTFMDESGKFRDRKVVCFGGVSAYNEFFALFADEWGRLLLKNGLQVLNAKDSFNWNSPLSAKNNRTGLKERIEDLLPFIACIRKHLQLVTGVTVDVAAYRELPQQFHEVYDRDPIYMAFARALLQATGFTGKNNKLGFTCDDDLETGNKFFILYRKIRRVMPDIRHILVAITFAEDRYLFGLQAADVVSGLMRLEAGKKMLGVPYDYETLFHELSSVPKPCERIWEVSACFADKKMLENLANSLIENLRKKKSDERARNK